MLGRLAHRFDFRVECGADSHLGLVRSENQDAWHADADGGFFVLADGMGGHAAGDVAAQLAVRTAADALRGASAIVRAFVTSRTLEQRRHVFAALREAAEKANERVRAEARKASERAGMGSTLDIVLLAGERAFVLHVGDGRVYLLRPDVTVQLTNDHDVRAVVSMQGSMPPPARTPYPNRLLNAIGIGDAIACECVSFDVTTGDRLVLCTDGVHGMIGDEAALGVAARRGSSATDAAGALVRAALDRGGRDNATAVVVDVKEARVSRKARSRSPTRDLEIALASPLLEGLTQAFALRLLSAAVEVELEAGRIPRVVTRDRVAYIVLDGEVQRSDGTALGAGAVLYAESLVDARRPRTYEAATPAGVRALRLRADDFREVTGADPRLAAAFFEKLARHLAHIDR